MKNVFLALVIALAIPAMAQDSIEAKGRAFYKDHDGKIAVRELTLVAPTNGKGDFFLKFGDKSFKAHGTKMTEQHGRKVLTVVFLNPPGAPKGTAAGFVGTVLKGSNLGLFYGDIFSKVVEGGRDAATADSLLNSLSSRCEGGQCEGTCPSEGQCDGNCDHDQAEGHEQGHQDGGQQQDGGTCDHHDHTSGIAHIGGFGFGAKMN